jgi:serine protease
MKHLRTRATLGALCAAVMAGGLAIHASGATPVTATAPVTRLSDFNRDGFTDLVARDRNGLLWLYRGNGAGGFMLRRQIGHGWNNITAIVTPGDVTGDGNADLISRDSLGGLWLHPGNGIAGLNPRRRIGPGWASYHITNGANVNGVGRPDLLAYDSTGVLWLYPISGNAVFGRRSRIGPGWGSYTIWGPGDASGDARADLLAQEADGQKHWLYRGNGTGGFPTRTLAFSSASVSALAAPGNFDRAAGNDLIIRDFQGRLWLHPGNNAGGFGDRRQIGTGWNIMTFIG